ncbi:histamine H2 receptor-like [Actinia tenebrosa]|uniref:Histamine H2 receptor-like n=1 Tax=Actinia tenebrosa TaxID=6105 RepID=A0A6P8IVD1_ACTTE|nr:histamine H2 receptor-like [Actinia tenebrosa]
MYRMANSSNFTTSAIPPRSGHPDQVDLYIVILTSALIGILIILTIAGNVMVLLTFCLCKELRSITNYFLISLSIADLLTALLAMPIFLLLRITNEQWNFPGAVVFRNIFVAVDIICGSASIWNLCLISMDRFLAIRMPLKHMVILTPRRAQVVIVIAWALALLVSSLLYTSWPYKVYPIVTLSFFLPLTIIIFSYVNIYRTMRNRTFVQRRRAGAKLKRDFRMAKQMILVIGSFIVCWFGFFVVNVILALTIPVDLVVLNIVKVLTYLNSCINPLLFTFISQKFKVAFSQIFHCQKPNLRKSRLNSRLIQDENSRYGYSVINNSHSATNTVNGTKTPTPQVKRRILAGNRIYLERETTV